MAARERPPARFEKGQVAVPAAVGLPLVLEPDGGRQPFLDRTERPDLALHLERLRDKTVAEQGSLHAVFVVSEARDPARLLPLIHVEGHHAEAGTRLEGPPGTLDDGVGGAEMRRDQIGRPAAILIALDICLVKLHIDEPGPPGALPGLADQRRVAVEPHDMSTAGREQQRQPPPAAAQVEQALAGQLLFAQQREKSRGDRVRVLEQGHSDASSLSALKYLA